MEISKNLFNAGLGAVQSGQRRIDLVATDIAGSIQRRSVQPQAEAADLASSLVALDIGKFEAQASAKVIEAADAALGTLIDTHA
ncbi:hypothetical protein OXH74_10325 [Metapseudomonas boanensis]